MKGNKLFGLGWGNAYACKRIVVSLSSVQRYRDWKIDQRHYPYRYIYRVFSHLQYRRFASTRSFFFFCFHFIHRSTCVIIIIICKSVPLWLRECTVQQAGGREPETKRSFFVTPLGSRSIADSVSSGTHSFIIIEFVWLWCNIHNTIIRIIN